MIRRDLLLLIGLLSLIVVLLAVSSSRSAADQRMVPTSHSAAPGGALALYRWLESLGYQVERLQYQRFAPPAGADLLVVLGPSERYNREEAEAVRAWVDAGGVLLVAEQRLGAFAGAQPLLAAFELQVALDEADPPGLFAPVLQPVLGAPLATRLHVRQAAQLASERNDLAPLAGRTEAPVLVGMQHGAGYVFASAAVHPFTNLGLRDRENAAMVLNLLRRIPPGSRIVFDEVHHGFESEDASLRTLLLGTPWGWATLYVTALGAGYLILTGRRMGRPVPLQAEAARRSSGEYLESMAGLWQRAGKRADLLAHYRHEVRRRLARAHGLAPDLDDAALVTAIAATNPELARTAADLLARMAQPPTDDATMLALVAEADALLAF
ncbi:MAG: DUF4350 domain-containing protein [Oscillochloridaceae bacterium umkhey_bin13]